MKKLPIFSGKFTKQKLTVDDYFLASVHKKPTLSSIGKTKLSVGGIAEMTQLLSSTNAARDFTFRLASKKRCALAHEASAMAGFARQAIRLKLQQILRNTDLREIPRPPREFGLSPYESGVMRLLHEDAEGRALFALAQRHPIDFKIHRQALSDIYDELPSDAIPGPYGDDTRMMRDWAHASVDATEAIKMLSIPGLRELEGFLDLEKPYPISALADHIQQVTSQYQEQPAPKTQPSV